MNNTQTMQPQNVYRAYQSTSPAKEDDFISAVQAMQGLAVLSFTIGVVIFIIWIWSMLSMISLNLKFSKFLDAFDAYADDRQHRTAVVQKASGETEVIEERVPGGAAKNEIIVDKRPKYNKKRLTVLAIISLVLILCALIVLWIVG